MGSAVFADLLAQFAQETADARLGPVVARLTAPVRVAVRARDGVGGRTLARALADRWRLVDADADAELAVVVYAETAKPEDTAELARWPVPAVLVRNKADLGGDGPGVRCVALLADVALDEQMVAALRVLVDEPADLRSTDAFLDGDHRLDRDARDRLVCALDRHGIAVCTRALGRGVDAAALPALLRAASGIDGVHRGLEAGSAAVHYRRVRSAVADLWSVALRGDRADVIAEFLAGDDAVLAVMSAAVDVLQAAGLTVDPGDSEAAHLSRARHWRAYSRGPVTALHRACGADVCRGSLRLLGHRP